MTNIYEEAYKEAERKIKKLSEDFKKDLDNILKECTKKKSQIGEECDNWYKSFETKNKGLFETMKDCHTLAQKLLQVKPELRDWLEVNYKEYL